MLENSVFEQELKAQKAVIDILLSTGSSSTEPKQEATSPRKENTCSNDCRNALLSAENEIKIIKLQNEEFQKKIIMLETTINQKPPLQDSINKTATLQDSIKDLSMYITKLETKGTKTNNQIDTVEDSIKDLSKCITKFENIDEFVSNKIRESSSSYSNNLGDLTKRITSLESLCTQLNDKIDSINNRHLHQVPVTSSSNVSNNLTYNQSTTVSTPNHPRSSPAPSPKTCIILGDSNTKYVKLADKHLDSHRVPTYLIEDIDHSTCIGYKKIWIHIGINNMKTLNCRNNDDIHRHFNTLMQKLNAIRFLCPYSKVMVSPILPTAIPILNKRALFFNKLLFAQRNWFTTLDFNLFCGNDGNLMDVYRCYNNRNDRIHLGSLGIQILSSKAKHHLSQLDTRSYATAVRSY